MGGRRGGKGKEGRRGSDDQVVTYDMFRVTTHRGQLLHIIIRGAQRCKTNFLKQKILLKVSCYQSSVVSTIQGLLKLRGSWGIPECFFCRCLLLRGVSLLFCD